MKFKPTLFFVHRWLGIAMCLLFALWFASGIIMMYVEYPELTEEERLANLTELTLSQVRVSPGEALRNIEINYPPTEINLSNVLGRPAYQFGFSARSPAVVFADDGTSLNHLSEAQVLEAARHSGFHDSEYEIAYDQIIDVDQWTLTSSLDSLRPLHRVDLNDDAGTVLYISDVTGKIVRDTNRNEMIWNWLGSTIHWIYPAILRQNSNLWAQVIIHVSLIGIASVITGGIIGFMRIRVRNLYQGKSQSPYTGIMKLHHVLGLLTFVFVSTFIFSGLMSMGPWGIFASSNSYAAQVAGYTDYNSVRPIDLPMVTEFPESLVANEISWHSIAGEIYLVSARSAYDKSAHFDLTSTTDQSLKLLANITAALPDLIPESKILSLDLISEYDDYYYSRHNRFRPLPVYRVKFDDEESTWFHIDLNTGEVVNRLTQATRLERWIYNGLHSLDFQFLWKRRPLWDAVVIVLSVLGLVFSFTSVVIGWRRFIQ